MGARLVSHYLNETQATSYIEQQLNRFKENVKNLWRIDSLVGNEFLLRVSSVEANVNVEVLVTTARFYFLLIVYYAEQVH